jgi:hypothetical protein
MARKTKRRFIPSSVQSRYLGILKKMGGEPLVVHGKAVLARIRARRPAPAEALGGITSDLPVPRGPSRPRPQAPGHAGRDLKPCLPCAAAMAAAAPSDVLGRVACLERCKKLNGERAVAECVAGCMGLLALETKN